MAKGWFNWGKTPPPIDSKRTLYNMYEIYLSRLNQVLGYWVRTGEVTPQEAQQIYQEARSTLNTKLDGKEWILTSQPNEHSADKQSLMDELSISLPYFDQILPEGSYKGASQTISANGFSEDPIGWRQTIGDFEKNTVLTETKVNNYMPRLLPYLVDQSSKGKIKDADIPNIIAQAKAFIQQGVGVKDLPYTSGVEDFEKNLQEINKQKGVATPDQIDAMQTRAGNNNQNDIRGQQLLQGAAQRAESVKPGGSVWESKLPSNEGWIRDWYAQRNYPISSAGDSKWSWGVGMNPQEYLAQSAMWQAGPEVPAWMTNYIEKYQPQQQSQEEWLPYYRGLYGNVSYRTQSDNSGGGASARFQTEPVNYKLGAIPNVSDWLAMTGTQRGMFGALGTSPEDLQNEVMKRQTRSPRGAGNTRWVPMRQGV